MKRGEGMGTVAPIADGSVDQPLVWGALAQMTRRPEQLVGALLQSGVRRIAVNRRYPQAVEAVEHFAREAGITVERAADVYPFSGGIPLHELTGELWVSVAGAVRRPLAAKVEPGTMIGDLLEQADPLDEYPAILLGTGPARARVATRWDKVGPEEHSVLVLPQDHPLVKRYRRTWAEETRIGMSLCSNCRLCTDGCPQYLAGRPVEPHRLMRAMLHGGMDGLEGLADCDGCNLCSLVLCPVELSPGRWAADLAASLRAAGAPIGTGVPHPFRDGRRVSVRRLALRLGLGPYMQQKPIYVAG